MLLGEDGIIKTAQEAKNTWEGAVANEEEAIENLVNELNSIINNEGGTGGESNPPVPPKSEVAEAIDEQTEFESTTPIKDDLDNTVYIPGGFKLARDSGTKAENGIVIEDISNGNQFVWIPTGEYNVSITLNAEGKLTNELSRRQWGTTANVEQEPELLTEDEVARGDNNGEYYYGEGNTNSVAKDQIGAFKTSATTKGGFYIGRYETGTGNVCKAGAEPYVNITRDTAKSEAEAMYRGNDYVVSELISSYAWDTALNFICQTNTDGYTLATTTDEKYGNMDTGSQKSTGEDQNDKYSNIHDLLGNCSEWTTEYSSFDIYSCVGRGGICSGRIYHPAYRGSSYTSDTFPNISFRPQLYVK